MPKMKCRAYASAHSTDIMPRRYSSWPTIPQCYVEGEFIGGCDIMIELYQSGELQEMIEKAAAEA